MAAELLLLLGFPLLLVAGLFAIRQPSLLIALSIYTVSLDHMGRLQLGLLTVNNLLKILLVGVTLIWMLTRDFRLFVPRHLLWLLFLALFIGASAFYSPNFLGNASSLSAPGYALRIVIVWFYALVVANFIRCERDLAYLLIACAATALVVSVLAHMQTLNALTLGGLMLVEKQGPDASGIRAVSTFWDSNRMGQFLAALAVFMTTTLALPTLNRLWKLAILAVLFSTFGAILLSFSRSAWLSLGLTLLMLLFVQRMRRVVYAFAVVGLLGILYLVFFTPYAGYLLDRVGTVSRLGEDFSGRFRWLLGLSGLRVWTDGLHWLWGAGAASFAELMPNYWHPAMSHEMIYHSGTQASHTFYVTILAEGGMIGLLLCLACARAVYVEARLAIRRRLAPLPQAVLVAVVVLLAVRPVDFILNSSLPDNLLWLSLGLLGALSR